MVTPTGYGSTEKSTAGAEAAVAAGQDVWALAMAIRFVTVVDPGPQTSPTTPAKSNDMLAPGASERPAPDQTQRVPLATFVGVITKPATGAGVWPVTTGEIVSHSVSPVT